MPQLTDRSKLPNIVDAVIRDTMDLKHLYQVHSAELQLLVYYINYSSVSVARFEFPTCNE